jgi:hypothetical protein
MNMNELVKQINASGGHAESSTMKTFEHVILAFCDSCGKRYFIAHSVFLQTAGRCSCSWNCCSKARLPNKAHDRHMAYRQATMRDIADMVHAGFDFRKEPI